MQRILCTVILPSQDINIIIVSYIYLNTSLKGISYNNIYRIIDHIFEVPKFDLDQYFEAEIEVQIDI